MRLPKFKILPSLKEEKEKIPMPKMAKRLKR